MLNPISFFTKPEYFFRPKQAMQRVQRQWKPVKPFEVFALPWGSPLGVHTNTALGSELWRYGIGDRGVLDTIIRLADRGEMALDVGANVGLTCSLAAAAVGPTGNVIAFEPHPEVYKELKSNADRWSLPNLRLENVALGAENGEAFLVEGPKFHQDPGTASICLHAKNPVRRFKVRLCRLDDYIPEPTKIGLCKIDVEGYELAVLQGARRALEQHRIRDIVFEDFAPQPSAISRLLQECGYSVFYLKTGWAKPMLVPLSDEKFKSLTQTGRRIGSFAYNYLATLDDVRAAGRFRRIGWQCLSRISREEPVTTGQKE